MGISRGISMKKAIPMDEVTELLNDEAYFEKVINDMCNDEIEVLKLNYLNFKDYKNQLSDLKLVHEMEEEQIDIILNVMVMFENNIHIDGIDKAIEEIKNKYYNSEQTRDSSQDNIENYFVTDIKDIVKSEMYKDLKNKEKELTTINKYIHSFENNNSYHYTFENSNVEGSQTLFKYNDLYILISELTYYTYDIYGYTTKELDKDKLIVTKYLDLNDLEVKDID